MKNAKSRMIEHVRLGEKLRKLCIDFQEVMHLTEKFLSPSETIQFRRMFVDESIKMQKSLDDLLVSDPGEIWHSTIYGSPQDE